jgi:hypothetical protein
MGNSKVFDYDQPTRDSLAGVYVEASDDGSDRAGGIDTESAGQTALFGLTVTVEDSANAEQSDTRPASRGSAFPG